MGQPLCICCGKKIAKKTSTVWFNADATPPRTLEEAKKRTNLQVVSHRWWETEAKGKYVINVSTWDGESYVDPFFCNGTCVKRLAYAAARAGYRLKQGRAE